MPAKTLPDITEVRAGLKRFASGFTSGQKAVTIFAVFAAVVGGFIVLSFTGKPTYAPLFTNLQPADAANITSKLAADKVAYKLADGGTVVMVPAGDVDQERVTLAQAGLPASNSVGLSLLDKEGITASNMTQQADYLQALQGELEQTIDSIQGVSSSQVNIALPANQDFALNNDNPTGASVMVTMMAGQTLSNGDVAAIVHLAGSSVPNLDANNVTVADSNGNLLAGPGMAASGGATNSGTSSYDDAQQAKVAAYLSAILGANNSDVQVNATLNYDQIATNTQSIVPAAKGNATGFCTQTNNSTSTYKGGAVPAGGAAGSTTVVTTATGTGSYVQKQTTQTCETNQETRTDQQAAGTVTAQSVAVLINSKALPAGVNLATLRQGVAATAGIVLTRGDTLAFSAVPFNSAAAQQAAKAAAAAALLAKQHAKASLYRTVAVVLVIMVVLFLVWRAARKARRTAAPSLLRASDLAALQAVRSGEDMTSVQPAIALTEPKRAELATINTFVNNQPDEVAQLLRSWLDDQRESTVS